MTKQSNKPVIAPRMLRIPEAAQYIGSTNWFMEELLRNGLVPFSQMGNRKVVDVQDLDKWLESYKQSEAYRQAVEKWKIEYPNIQLPNIPMTDKMAQDFFANCVRDEDGTLISDPDRDED